MSAVAGVTSTQRTQIDADAPYFGRRRPLRAWTLKGHFRCDARNLGSLWVRETAHTIKTGMPHGDLADMA
ncbi:hypothetical protein TNCT1_39640 [Streptomyces sp. 1-11]|nr:hypothetical protein TNCT1_39640 [Streptomyces sp. 1-11]